MTMSALLPTFPDPELSPDTVASALDALGVMLLRVSFDGRVLALSRAARERLGWGGGVLDEALSASGARGLARRIAVEGPVSWESAWDCANGNRIRVRVAVELEAHADGHREAREDQHAGVDAA